MKYAIPATLSFDLSQWLTLHPEHNEERPKRYLQDLKRKNHADGAISGVFIHLVWHHHCSSVTISRFRA